MPRFMVTRTLPPLTDEELDAVARQVIAVCRQLQGVEWVCSHLAEDGRYSFCILEAPSSDACHEHAARVGLPVDAVFPLSDTIGPCLYT